MNNDHEIDHHKISPQIEAVIRLSQQLSSNNNTVSGAMELISENLSEVSKSIERIEDKLDTTIDEVQKHTIVWDDKTSKQVRDLLNKLEETGFIKFLSFIKKAFLAVTMAITVSGIIYVSKTVYQGFKLIERASEVTSIKK